jgi:hypothetical protein
MAARRRTPKRVQDTEQRLLSQAVQEANRWLGEGKFSAGYRCLLAGLERAREWEDGGEPWAKDLLASWRAALHEYAALYPAPLETPGAATPPLPPPRQDVFVRRRVVH